MYSRLTRPCLTLALASVILVGSLSQIACSKDEIRSAAKTASVSITVIRSLRDTNASLLQRGKITKEESDQNVRLMMDASAAAGQLNDRAREALDEVNAIDAQLAADPNNEQLKAKREQVIKSAGANLKPLAKAVARTVINLNEQGVLRVKNPEARASLSDLMGFLLDIL